MLINPTDGYKVAFPTDEHYPFQDENARHVALQIVRDRPACLRVRWCRLLFTQ